MTRVQSGQGASASRAVTGACGNGPGAAVAGGGVSPSAGFTGDGAVPPMPPGSGWARHGGAVPVVRLLVLGGLIAAGWVLAVIFAVFGAATASAETTPVGLAGSYVAAPVDSFDVPTAVHSAPGRLTPRTLHGDGLATAEAMAGRLVDGLTSQSTPSLPAPATADHGMGLQGLMPQPGGGSGPIGPGLGDVARSSHDPRQMVLSAPFAAVPPPVVRTAADDPSFSPD